MKLLVTGARGQLGLQIRAVLERGKSELGEIDDIYKKAEIKYVSYSELDITILKDVLEYTEEYKPDIIISCAAYTNVTINVESQTVDHKATSKYVLLGQKYCCSS